MSGATTQQTPRGGVVVTGAGGFIGRRLTATLAAAGVPVIGLVRSLAAGSRPPPGVDLRACGDLTAVRDWRALLAGATAVVHCAARAHVLHESSADPIAAFRRANVETTVRLAEAAEASGADRLVFLSSIGAATVGAAIAERGWDEAAAWRHLPYQTSKWAAEQALFQLPAGRLSVVALRPPLVYGPEAPGNFGLLVRAVRRRYPLPLALVRNQRSMVFLDNLISAILACLTVAVPARGAFAVCDDETVSTPDLIRRLAAAFGVPPPRLVPVPVSWLDVVLRAVGKAAAADGLLGSLVVDNQPFKAAFAWQPPVPLDVALRRSVGGENLVAEGSTDELARGR